VPERRGRGEPLPCPAYRALAIAQRVELSHTCCALTALSLHQAAESPGAI
jgi:hypothetical protein